MMIYGVLAYESVKTIPYVLVRHYTIVSNTTQNTKKKTIHYRNAQYHIGVSCRQSVYEDHFLIKKKEAEILIQSSLHETYTESV